MFQRIILSVLLLLVAMTRVVVAHDAWIEKRDGQLIVIYGHGEKHDPYDPAEVKDCKGIDAKGYPVAVEIIRGLDKASLAPRGDPAVLTMFYDRGYRAKTTDGWKKGTKSSLAGQTEVLEALKIKRFCKAFFAPCDTWSKPVGQRLEIVPLKNPMTVRKGDKLPVKLLLDGKPLEGVAIETGDIHSDNKDSVQTDKEGLAHVSLGQQGVQMVKAGHKIPFRDDPEVHAVYLSAVLTFPLASP